MNTNNNTRVPYTINARSVVFTDTEVIVSFFGGKLYQGPLAGLKEFARVNELDRPTNCRSNGARHGLYPCLRATNETAQAISMLAGRPIAAGDGMTFGSRSALLKAVAALRAAGIVPPPEALAWGITDAPYAEEAKPAVPASMDNELPF